MPNNNNRSEKRIGLLIDESKPYGRGVLVGISQFSRDHPQTLFHVEVSNAQGLANLIRWKPMGMLVMINQVELERTLLSLKIPIVNLCSASGKDMLRVQSDNDMVGQIAAEHLLQPEVETYGYVGLEEGTYVTERGTAFKKAINDAGRACEVFMGPRPGLEAWLSSQKKPLAVMTSNDTVGNLVLEVCRTLKFNVPEDVMIVGVDNNEALSELFRPGLSSIELDTKGIGSRACDLMVRALKGQISERLILIPPKGLVVRGSSRRQMVNDPLLTKMLSDIEKNANTSQPLQDLVDAAPVSRMTIERKFRRLVGRTPLQEIRRVRINKAKELLGTTQLPLKLIAKDCGFSAPSRLIESFLRETGMTPTDYRKQRNASSV